MPISLLLAFLANLYIPMVEGAFAVFVTFFCHQKSFLTFEIFCNLTLAAIDSFSGQQRLESSSPRIFLAASFPKSAEQLMTQLVTLFMDKESVVHERHHVSLHKRIHIYIYGHMLLSF